MNGKKLGKSTLILLCIFIVLIVVIFIVMSHRALQKRVMELEKSNSRLIDLLQKNRTLSAEIKYQLENMIERFKTINSDIANELLQATELLMLGHIENAIEDLSKIMENLLRAYYKDDLEFSQWRNKKGFISFQELLDYSKAKGRINRIEYQFYLAVKEIRNGEAHEVNMNIPGYLNASGLLVGIGGILKLTPLVYPEKRLE